jgi:hypothetical protein
VGPAAPNEIRIETVGKVPSSAPDQIRRWAEQARDFYYRALGLYVDGAVTLKVIDSTAVPIHAATYLAEGDRISSITVNVGSAAWQLESAVERHKVVAHEYFHVIQDWLHGPSYPLPEAFFLVEGAAEYAGYAAVIDAGELTHERFRSEMHARLRRLPLKLAPLDRLSSKSPGPDLPKYYLAALAVDFLVGQAKLRPLAEYFAMRRTLPVEQAFHAAFLRTLHSFYSNFSLWRSAHGV